MTQHTSCLTLGLLCCSLLVPLGPGAAPAAAGGAKESPWLTDYTLALKAAKQSGKPIFAVFR